MGIIENLFVEKQKDWIVGRLKPDNTPKPIQQKELSAGQEYVTVELKSLRIPFVRKGWTKFYGVVHSYISLAYSGSSSTAEFTTVTVPKLLKDLDPSKLANVVVVNQPVGGPVPYGGGAITLELGLFSLKSQDLIGPFLDLLGSLSQQAGVAYVSQAMPFVGPIKKGIELLTGTGKDVDLQIGIFDENNSPTTGWYVVIGADKQSPGLNLDQIRVDPRDGKLLDANKNAVTDFPYFVYTVSVSEQRDTWWNIPELKQKYDTLRNAIKEQSGIQAVSQALASLKMYLLMSPDLLTKDALRISQEVEKMAQTACPALQQAAGTVSTRGMRRRIQKGDGSDIGELKELQLY
jgi:hypothetical protein